MFYLDIIFLWIFSKRDEPDSTDGDLDLDINNFECEKSWVYFPLNDDFKLGSELSDWIVNR
jgi:hypothetical protein